jgi:hypothetical protein
VAGTLGYMLSVSGGKKSGKELIGDLKKASNFDILYNAEFNVNRYISCYADRSACNYLLGSGFLDVSAAIQKTIKEPTVDTSKFGRQPLGGCVLSSVAGQADTGSSAAYLSLPVLLLALRMVLPLFAKKQKTGMPTRG